MVILVTGASGQLGLSLQDLAKQYPEFVFHFFKSKDLDITNAEVLNSVFNTIQPNFCINTAAYTAVDKAEIEIKQATLVNVSGARNLAVVCKMYECQLIHISTDFVFDGLKSSPYTELDTPAPINVYGQSKLDGEREIASIMEKYFIVRTSWLYSIYGNNFMKTMLKLASERTSISVVNDQFGTPTAANDLADVLLQMIIFSSKNTPEYGIYHFSNEGQASWYDFAKAIFNLSKTQIELLETDSTQFVTLATRPKYSVLCKDKIAENFGISINPWISSLQNCITKL